LAPVTAISTEANERKIFVPTIPNSFLDIDRRAIGRPTKYRPEYADLLLAYFQMPAWDTIVNGKFVRGYFPTLGGFCCQIGVAKSSVLGWACKKNASGNHFYPEFHYVYELSKDYQEDYLVKGYMAGKYSNPAVGALIAKTLLKWRDKQDLDQTVNATVTSTVSERVELDFSVIMLQARMGH
jgi:hypothetical protein